MVPLHTLTPVAATQVQGDAREVDIQLLPDDTNIYRWTAYLQASSRERVSPRPGRH